MQTHVIHTYADAAAYLRQKDPVRLSSPPGAAGLHGIGWWQVLTRQLRADFAHHCFEMVLDCGNDAALAVAALQAGAGPVSVQAPPQTLQRLSQIAARCQSRLIPHD